MVNGFYKIAEEFRGDSSPKKDYNIYIFGDSHAKCFYRNTHLSFDNVKIFNTFISSASMKGLTNPNSTLNHKDIIINTLKNSNQTSQNICVLKFGQVDIEYNYYFKIYNKGENINRRKFYSNLIKDYMFFVKDLKKLFPTVEFIVNGVNMPNIYNLQKYMQIPTMPSINYSTQFDYHFTFNLNLNEKCRNHKIFYFDLTNETTYNKSLNPQFIGKDNHFSGAEHPDVLNGESGENYNTYNVFIGKLLKTILNINLK
tara:strand:+ start:71 stop:838 length:768 start_codon:yes stop_codon:yes gene_type:complete